MPAGRPPIGPTIKIALPESLIADIDAAADGTTRAETIRRLLSTALAQRSGTPAEPTTRPASPVERVRAAIRTLATDRLGYVRLRDLRDYLDMDHATLDAILIEEIDHQRISTTTHSLNADAAADRDAAVIVAGRPEHLVRLADATGPRLCWRVIETVQRLSRLRPDWIDVDQIREEMSDVYREDLDHALRTAGTVEHETGYEYDEDGYRARYVDGG